MELISQKAQLGLNAVIFVAYHATKETPIAGAAIAEHYSLNSRALEPVLQILGNSGLLQSIRGHSGGYYMERPDKVTMADILQCFTKTNIRKTNAFSEFTPTLETAFEDSHRCFWKKLSLITIQNLCDSLTEQGVPTRDAEILTFQI